MSTPERKGRLYRVDPDGSCNLLLEEVGCSNGMAFDADCRSFYHTDSFAYEIHVFDYDIETGDIQNQKLFARFTETDGMPDGLTMDADCGLWTALWGGSGNARLRPNGEVERRIGLPTPKTSSLTFAGQDYRDLYATTAGGKLEIKMANWPAHCFAYGTRRKECPNSVQMFVCLIDRIREEL
jgi:D-xylono/L-arabinono-1,4-lactonase